ncbi:phosphate-starvation-inducible PsiE family protein [Klebsiella pneumoniae]
MPAFEWVHVQLHQQKGMISLSPPTICNSAFQSVFGMIMTLLIAMEFKHSIVRVALRRDSIIQVKTVVLIAVIALSRKFVILDSDASPAKIAALAGATLALGATYWLLRKRGDRAAETSEHDPSSSE